MWMGIADSCFLHGRPESTATAVSSVCLRLRVVPLRTAHHHREHSGDQRSEKRSSARCFRFRTRVLLFIQEQTKFCSREGEEKMWCLSNDPHRKWPASGGGRGARMGRKKKWRLSNESHQKCPLPACYVVIDGKWAILLDHHTEYPFYMCTYFFLCCIAKLLLIKLSTPCQMLQRWKRFPRKEKSGALKSMTGR